MTLTQKLLKSLLLYKRLYKSFTTTDNNEFHRLRKECIIDGVDPKDFDDLMNAIQN